MILDGAGEHVCSSAICFSGPRTLLLWKFGALPLAVMPACVCGVLVLGHVKELLANPLLAFTVHMTDTGLCILVF